MRYLLDTSAFLWHLISPEKLNDDARRIIGDAGSELWLSIASVWEVAIKHALGRLELPAAPAEFVASRIELMGVRLLHIEIRHIAALGRLPHHHRDPFDRMLVAEVASDDLQLITSDAQLQAYAIPVISAVR